MLKELFFPKKIIEKFFFIILIMIFLFNIIFLDKYYSLKSSFTDNLTLFMIVLGIIMNFFRAYSLTPFRGKFFIITLYLSNLILVIYFLDYVLWFGLIEPIFNMPYSLLSSSIFGSIFIFFILSYYLIFPLLYLYIEKFRVPVNIIGLPIPRFYHGICFILSIILSLLAPLSMQLSLLHMSFFIILILVFYMPLNREIFSRKVLKYN